MTVMTDFRERTSVTVSDTAMIDEALEHMRHTAVRCAFTIDYQSGIVVGLITAYDILGEKPLQYMQSAAIPVAKCWSATSCRKCLNGTLRTSSR